MSRGICKLTTVFYISHLPNKAMGLVIIGIVVFLGLIAILIYNRLVGLRQNVRQGWADIDAQLRQRHDLIPNLVEAVKGYAGHESATLEAVIAARNAAAAGTPDSGSEQQLRGALDNLLALGDPAAQALGVSVNSTRRQVLLLAVLLASGAVAVAGTVAFIGLLAPHLARLLVGADHRRLLPLSALLGGFLLLVADTLGRSLLSPLEVPAGIMTALLGAPYFLYLLSRYRRVI